MSGPGSFDDDEGAGAGTGAGDAGTGAGAAGAAGDAGAAGAAGAAGPAGPRVEESGVIALPPTVTSRVARRRREQRPVQGRGVALVVAAVVLLGVGLVGWLVPAPAAPPVPPTGDGVGVAPTDASSSSFFCTTGAGADAGADATGQVVLTNSTRAPAHGSMTTVGTSGGTQVTRAVTVPALGTVEVNPGARLPPGGSASTFTFVGGGVTGTATISSPQGWSTAPCSSEVSSQWDFVGGSTNSGLLDLSLYNPTAAPSVVDTTFLTTDGNVLDPQSYQGVSLAPGELTIESVGTYVQGQSVVATLVQAQSGNLVATELDQLAVSSGTGLALVNGTPGPSATWRFAQTTAVQGGSVAIAVANPGSSPVTADVTVGIPGASVEPHVIQVPAQTVAMFQASQVAGWPLGSPYALTVTASGPVVVGRIVSGPAGATAPQAGISPGVTTTSASWLVSGPGTPGNVPDTGAGITSLAVADPGASPVDVSVVRLGGHHPVAMARIGGHGVVVFSTASVGGLTPLVVGASAPVSVEADYGPSGAPGVVASSGFPIGG